MAQHDNYEYTEVKLFLKSFFGLDNILLAAIPVVNITAFNCKFQHTFSLLLNAFMSTKKK